MTTSSHDTSSTAGTDAGTESDVEARRPRVGVAVIIARGDTVLLGLRRSTTHGDNSWQFPGGHLEYRETPEACAHREALEETGLDIEVTHRGGWTSDVFPEGRHYITVFVHARSETGTPERREPDKCLEWRWCRWDALPEPLFLPVRSLLGR
ncbi:MAG: NUDIX domain-containing protein [Gemmatimonadetes bacterium]|nr:NUDIX domain-containing protein [Gemmatimonadota bacterium]